MSTDVNLLTHINYERKKTPFLSFSSPLSPSSQGEPLTICTYQVITRHAGGLASIGPGLDTCGSVKERMLDVCPGGQGCCCCCYTHATYGQAGMRITYDFRVHGQVWVFEAAAPAARASCGCCRSFFFCLLLLLSGTASANRWYRRCRCCRRRSTRCSGVVCSCCGCWASLFSKTSPRV